MSSSTSVPLSSLGVGAGINSESIISALVAVDQKPIDQLASEQSSMKTQLSSIGKLASLTSTMRDAAKALTQSSLWQSMKVSSADSTVVTGSVADGGAAGNYGVSVQALASGQTITSGSFSSSSATLNTGKLTIQLGTWSGSNFTSQSGSSPVSITIGSGDTSLSSIRDKINAANAGVTATIVNDANGARLSLRSSTTGAVNGFKVTATEDSDDGNANTGLSALGYDPSSSNSSPMSLNQSAGNAKATINGIQVESTTNTFSNVADGLTITVGKVSSSEVALTSVSNTDSMKTAVNAFVTSYNALVSYIKDQTKYTPPTSKGTQGVGGPLQGDSTTMNLLSQMRSVINATSTASGTYQHLSDLGISTAADGTLTVTSKLDTALANPSELAKAMATDGTDAGSSGFMDRFLNLGNAVLDSTSGSLQLSQNALNDKIKRNQDRQDQLTDHLNSYEARLRAQYQTLDTQMASLNALSSYVTQQVSALSKSA
ncbi:flagellar filament capping protein FliD [Ideonella sp. B508-1]|uniref:flagellar filament capping protein FliD n=1 Tax=Ideonella sp. B508-1 TaxID=137716 RepID=UPI000348063B|nr:flagellar filament capping protein FliD [Ideonella sp. B508-1]